MVYLLLSLLLCFSKADTDGPYTLLGVNGYSGNVYINTTAQTSYFYWLFEKIGGDISSDDAPLIIWLDGGPGGASEASMLQFYVTGFYFDDQGNIQRFSNSSWINYYHVMAIDNPIGAGYSYTNSESEMLTTVAGVSGQLYTFIQLIANKYPSWVKRDIYIFGHSAAGTWIPSFAYKILVENQAVQVTGNVFINLKGIGLGDPYMNPLYQSTQFANICYNIGISNKNQIKIVEAQQNKIISDLNNSQYYQAWIDFINVRDVVEGISDDCSAYDVRVYNFSLNTSATDAFMNLPSTKTLLHTPSFEYFDFNLTAQNNIAASFSMGITQQMQLVLENVKVMIFNGQDDLFLNIEGILNTLDNIKWEHMQRFLKTRKIVWKVNKEIAGYAMSYENLTLIFVLKSGHVVIHDQPAATLDMVQKFIENKPWN